MGNKYNHVSNEARIKIFELLIGGSSISEIAQIIGYHKATVYRELHRNSGEYGYRPDFASHFYWNRKHHKLGSKLSTNIALRNTVIQYLKNGWSPELIAGRLKKNAGKVVISRETIYRYIYSSEGLQLKLYKHLILQRRFRYPRIKRRRNMVANARKQSIHDREPEIENRSSYGHWEGDLVLFKKTKTNLFTLRERKSRYIIAIKNQSRKAHCTTQTLLKYMKEKFNNTVKTLTLDNDIAFYQHETIAKELNANVYFCDPYKSYQKGAIENANKLIRTQLNFKTKISDLTQEYIDNVIKKFNDRPMKCLNFKTPKEVFQEAFMEKSPLTASCT